jgi:hypothetical protein
VRIRSVLQQVPAADAVVSRLIYAVINGLQAVVVRGLVRGFVRQRHRAASPDLDGITGPVLVGGLRGTAPFATRRGRDRDREARVPGAPCIRAATEDVDRVRWSPRRRLRRERGRRCCSARQRCKQDHIARLGFEPATPTVSRAGSPFLSVTSRYLSHVISTT